MKNRKGKARFVSRAGYSVPVNLINKRTHISNKRDNTPLRPLTNAYMGTRRRSRRIVIATRAILAIVAAIIVFSIVAAQLC